MNTTGSRIKAERVRLGCLQSWFAQKGGVAKRTQAAYEAGERSPTPEYLEAIAKIGADIQFIVTGQVGYHGPPIAQDEARLIDLFRAAPGVVRCAVLAALGAVEHYHDDPVGEMQGPGIQSNRIGGSDGNA